MDLVVCYNDSAIEVFFVELMYYIGVKNAKVVADNPNALDEWIHERMKYAIADKVIRSTRKILSKLKN